MEQKRITQILSDTAYERTGGSAAERRCAEYLVHQCAALGLQATIEPFAVPMYTVQQASLIVNGVSYSCKGYFNSGSGTVQAPLYYLANTDACSLEKCKGKIVLVDGIGYWHYHDLVTHGALGFIAYNGDRYGKIHDIAQRELRNLTDDALRIPGVMIHAADAVKIAAQEGVAELTLLQETATGLSHNVVVELPGATEETVLFSAHYDSVELSAGAYDNMSGCIGLLGIAEYFAKTPHHYGIRLLFCGSEERGLLGSKAYCEQHELSDVILNVNLDMLGSVMGRFVGFAVNEQTKTFLEAFAAEKGFGMEARLDTRSSDSNVFLDNGVTSVSFARYAPAGTAAVHTRYDTAEAVSVERLKGDMDFITQFTERVVDAPFPLERQIAEQVENNLDLYFLRKRA